MPVTTRSHSQMFCTAVELDGLSRGLLLARSGCRARAWSRLVLQLDKGEGF